MSLDILNINPNPNAHSLFQDPITAVFIATNDRLNQARDKRNFNNPETLLAVQAIIKEQFENMNAVAKGEVRTIDDDDLKARVGIVVAALHEEAESCVNHGMLKEAAAYLRACYAITAINNRLSNLEKESK